MKQAGFLCLGLGFLAGGYVVVSFVPSNYFMPIPDASELVIAYESIEAEAGEEAASEFAARVGLDPSNLAFVPTRAKIKFAYDYLMGEGGESAVKAASVFADRVGYEAKTELAYEKLLAEGGEEEASEFADRVGYVPFVPDQGWIKLAYKRLLAEGDEKAASEFAARVGLAPWQAWIQHAHDELLAGAGEEAAVEFAQRVGLLEDPESKKMPWAWFGLSAGAMFVGLVLVRRSRSTEAAQSEVHQGRISVLKTALDKLVGLLTAINAEKETLNVYDVHERLDRDLVEELNRFVEDREAMIHVHGMQAYANLMGVFAGAERLINRAWSASADGYVDEVWRCLESAEQELNQVREMLAAQEAA